MSFPPSLDPDPGSSIGRPSILYLDSTVVEKEKTSKPAHPMAVNILLIIQASLPAVDGLDVR
jgi:hypothetical protein